MDQDTLLKIVGQLYITSYLKDETLHTKEREIAQLKSNLQANAMIIKAIREEYPDMGDMIDRGIKRKDEQG